MTRSFLDDLLVTGEAGNAKWLRATILDLAVRGRLLPDENHPGSQSESSAVDEPGQQLGQKPPFPCPAGWAWTSVRAVCLDSFYGPRFAKSEYVVSGGVPTIRTTDMTDTGDIQLDDPPLVKVPSKKLSLYRLQANDLLVTRTGSIGTMAVFPGGYLALPSAYLIRFRFSDAVDAHYVLTYLRSSLGQELMGLGTRQVAQPNLNAETIKQMPLPLPPLAEQKRIVVKVNQLMALCDDLEVKQTKKRTLATQASRSALAALVDAETDDELAVAWKRIGGRFRDFVTSPDDVALLRQACIELAMRGRVVAPSRSEGTGHDLLSQILEERRKAGRPRTSQETEADAAVFEQPFAIPAHWTWTRWADLVTSSEAGWSPQCATRPRGVDEWGVLKVSAVSWDRFDPDENKALLPGVKPRQECAVRVGDFLMSRANTAALVGRSVVVTEQPTRLLMSDKTVRCHFSPRVDRSFMNYYNRTDTARRHYVANASGTSDSMKNISRGAILDLPAPLPPLAEQKRIVAKVDQLMSLLDDLEAKLRKQEDLATRLAEALAVAVAA